MELKPKLPIYKIKINSSFEDESGVDYVALVDDPAIERNFIAFANQIRFKAADNERRIVTGALMIADLPIYRQSAKMGEYYVVFDKQTIEQIVQKFFKKGFSNNVNEMHQPQLTVDGMYMFESFIVDSSRGILAPKGFTGISEGSWIGSYKVENEDIWQNFIKTGEYKAFSVEGMFDLEPMGKSIEEEILNVIAEIEQLVS